MRKSPFLPLKVRLNSPFTRAHSRVMNLNLKVKVLNVSTTRARVTNTLKSYWRFLAIFLQNKKNLSKNSISPQPTTTTTKNAKASLIKLKICLIKNDHITDMHPKSSTLLGCIILYQKRINNYNSTLMVLLI